MAQVSKRPQKEKRLHTKSIKNCPLSDPSIGIISENDHKVGLCLCKFCECGSHKCYKDSSISTPQSSFITKYQHDYKKTYFDIPLRMENKLYRPDKRKMDLTTTNQREYKNRRPTPEVSKSVSFSPKKQEISRITAYASDFPDWGPIEVNHEKRWDPPVRSVDIPFVGKSSYKGQFNSFQQNQVDIYKSDITQFSSFGSKFSLAPKEKLNSVTTYQEKMQNFSGNQLNSRVVVRATPLTPTPGNYTCFQTTSKEFYKANSPVGKDPRQLRISLELKSSKRCNSLS